MASPGKNWAQGSWAGGEWAKSWDFTHDQIGDDWGSKVWGEGTWAPFAWYPDSILKIVKYIFGSADLTTAQTAEGGSASGYTLPAVIFVLKPGSILDLEKILPIAKFTFSSKTLDTAIVGTSVDAQTLGVVSQTFKAVDLQIGVILPVVQFVLSAEEFDTIGLELGAVKFVLRSRVSNDGLNITTTPIGLKEEHSKLVRKGKSMLRKSWTRAAEDLFNEIVDDVDAPDYGKET